ncbi:uncharacterized protein C8R40DRAFT_150674 [Lentinula edodes]|uniref:uncharacterized protein n=1 Tax=Lentinula edodes TaxID=5353 RepID=UPI001E8DFE0D|nr:uncharacterized protein C8R40DRAFT_150674 [Lentinula edodes]KAH7876092.1 hypothetical protein C8R40DRAFT_150674 [Lentinula edodes]
MNSNHPDSNPDSDLSLPGDKEGSLHSHNADTNKALHVTASSTTPSNVTSNAKEPEIGEKRSGEEHNPSDTHERVLKKPKVTENLTVVLASFIPHNSATFPSFFAFLFVIIPQTNDIAGQDGVITIDPALQTQTQTGAPASISSSLSSNPYAIYLTNNRGSTGAAPVYPQFVNPYYFLTLPPGAMSMPPHMHHGMPMMPPMYAYPPHVPVPVPIPRPQPAVSPSAPLLSSTGSLPESTMSPAQLQTEAPPAADSSVEQETTNQPSSSSSKPRRLKSHAVVSKHHSIPTIPRDKHGQPMLPLNVGIMTVVSLGTICLRDHFHSERYIFPVGYTVTRRYLSTLDPNSDVVYHCTILDGGDGPKFQIVPADDPDKPIMASTATGAWSSIVKKANEIRKRQHSNSVSGPDFFGLGQNTIRHLIQQMPGAERLAKRGTRTGEPEKEKEQEDGKNSADNNRRRRVNGKYVWHNYIERVNGIYVWQHYIEGGPLGGRHAAVIPALPEEYESKHRSAGTGHPSRNASGIVEGGSVSGQPKGDPPVSDFASAPSPNGTGTASTMVTSPSAGPSGTSKGTGLSYYPPHVMAQAEVQSQSQGHGYPHTAHLYSTRYSTHHVFQPAYALSQQPQHLQPVMPHTQSQENAHVQTTFASLLNSLTREQSEASTIVSGVSSALPTTSASSTPFVVSVPTTPASDKGPASAQSYENNEDSSKEGIGENHKEGGEDNAGCAEEMQIDPKLVERVVKPAFAGSQQNQYYESDQQQQAQVKLDQRGNPGTS